MSKIENLLKQIKSTAETAWVEVKATLETKANEVIHSTNTGFGEELMEQARQTKDIIDMTVANSTLLSNFRWNHGKDIPLLGATVPIIGDTQFYETDAEWETWAILSQVTQWTYKMKTAKVNIIPKKYKMTADISDEQLKNPAANIESIIMDKLSKGAIKTVEWVILNGDIVTAATGNVNSDDWAPTAKSYFLNSDGLRKEALVIKWVANTDTYDIGTLAWSDYVNIQGQTGYLGTNPTDWMWLSELKTHQKALTLTEYKDASQSGALSTIVKGKWALTQILGSDVIIPRDLRLTEADWKISVTPTNNTKGQIIYTHKDSVQYGFAWDYSFETVRVPWTWIQVIGWFYFGFDIVNQLAGETDPTVVVWFNATI